MRPLLLGLLVAACATPDEHGTTTGGHETATVTLTAEQAAFGCMLMGTGASTHVMCNHGHSISFRSENLWERHRALAANGVVEGSEADLMMADPTGHMGAALPEPLTPMVQARVGERLRIRLVSYGPQIHDFHVHGHWWKSADGPADVRELLPAQVYDGVEFFAGAGAESPEPRSGPGDWMYHCHVEPHIASGMWGVMRVRPAGATDGLDAAGRYALELPTPLGASGQTIDVFVAAVETPLAIAREVLPGAKELSTVERLARIYVPLADQTAFDAATAKSVRGLLSTQRETWQPWALVLRQGTTVKVHLKNLLPDAPATLHPHGVKTAIGSDGTTPESVAKPGGGVVTYEWTADTAGTWPLHDHARTLENLGRGLFAALVVKSPEDEKRITRDYLLVFHDYDHDWFMGFEPGASGGGGH